MYNIIVIILSQIDRERSLSIKSFSYLYKHRIKSRTIIHKNKNQAQHDFTKQNLYQLSP